MKDMLAVKLAVYPTPEERVHRLREYLQELVLKRMESHGSMSQLAFVGGTALRVLYELPRFSEDLDFSQIQDGFEFTELLHYLKKELELYGFSVTLTKKESGAVKSSFIKFTDLLFPLGLSPNKNQIISVKLEVDTNPPAGYELQKSLVNKSFLMLLQHFDKPSLFAGKCHALLCGSFAKGRDYFDLLWFMGQRITPNYTLLTNAYAQTQSVSKPFSGAVLKEDLIKKIEATDFKKVLADVGPFLLNAEDRRYFSRDVFLAAVSGWGVN